MSLSKIVWQTRRLGEVANIFNGNSINENEKKEKYLGLKSGTPYISTKDITFDNKIDFENGVLIPKDQAHKFKIVEANSVLICAEGGSAGRKFAHTNRNIFFGNKLFALTSNNKIDSKFVFYFYQSEEFYSLFGSKMSGLIGGVSINKFKEIEIPLPPIDEQKRIVKILDEVFLGLAKVKEATEKNLKNAREVFESYLEGVFENSKYEEKRIDEVAKIINGFSFDSKDFSSNNKVKSVKITNVGVGNFVEEENNFLPESYFDIYFDYQVHEGDVVIALTRTIISDGLKVAVVPKSYDQSLLNQRVASIRISKDRVSQSFLYNFLRTRKVADYVKSNVNTLMQPNLSINDLKKLLIPWPSSNERKQIVTKLDTLSTETKKLEEIYKQKLIHLEELKKSILKKAFNGEL